MNEEQQDWRTDSRKLQMATWTRAYGGRKIHLWWGKEVLCGARLKGYHHRSSNLWATIGYKRCAKCQELFEQRTAQEQET